MNELDNTQQEKIPTRKIFRVDNEDINADTIIDLTDNLLDKYLKSRHWGMDKIEDFTRHYNLIRAKILNGDIAGRGYDRSYADSKNEIADDDPTREVFYYIDRILGARKKKDASSDKGNTKYSNNHLLQSFMNRFFGGSNLVDLKAWEDGDYNEKDNTYTLKNRLTRFKDFLDFYLQNLKDSYDYSDSAYKDKDDLIFRLHRASEAIKNDLLLGTNSFSDELSALGFGEDFRNKMFRTSRGGVLDENSKFLAMLSPELKTKWEYLLKYGNDELKNKFKQYILSGNSGNVDAIMNDIDAELTKNQENSNWENFMKSIDSYMPLSLSGQRMLYDTSDEDVLDLEDIKEKWGKLGAIDFEGLRGRFVNLLNDYMNDSSNESEWDKKITQLYKNLGLHNDNSLLNYDDFRRKNRLVGLNGLPSVLSNLGNPLEAVNQYFLGNLGSKKWNDKSFIDLYRSIAERSKQSGQAINPIESNPNEYYIQGAWDPKKFLFYTYDASTNSIKSHRISESPLMLEAWKKENKNIWNISKKLQGGIFEQQSKAINTNNNFDSFANNKSTEEINREKAGLRELEDGMESEDLLRLAGIGADITSMVTSFIPIYGTALSGVLGVGSTLSSLAADVMDDSVSTGLVLSNLATNAGMTVLGMIPGGKSLKLFNEVKKWAPRILGVYGTSLVFLNPEVRKSFEKIVSSNSNDNITVDDWKNIGYGIASIAGLTRAGAAKYQQNKLKTTIKGSDKVTIKVNKDKEVDLTQEQLNSLNEAGQKGNSNALEYLNSILGNNSETNKLDFNFEHKNLINKLSLGRFGKNEIKGKIKPRETELNYNLINANRDKVKELNLWSRNRGLKQRLATDEEILNGSGYLKNVDGLEVKNVNTKPFQLSNKELKQLTKKENSLEELLNKLKQPKKENSKKDIIEELLKLKQKVKEPQKLLENKSPKLLDNNGTPFEGGYVDVVIQPKVGVKNEIKKLRKLRKQQHINDLIKLGIDVDNNLINNSRKVNAVRRALGLKEGDVNPFLNIFQDKDLNLYYWKKGGVIKAQKGISVLGRTSWKEETPEYQGYTPTSDFSKRNELSRLMVSYKHNNDAAKNRIKSLRDNYFEPSAITLQQTPLLFNSNLGTSKAVNSIQNSVLETSDPTINFLQNLDANLKIGDIYTLNDIRNNELNLQATNVRAQQIQKLQELNHNVAEAIKEKRSLLGIDIDNTNIARDYKNWLATDNYMKANSTYARLKEQAGEKAAYEAFLNQEKQRILLGMEPIRLDLQNWLKLDGNNDITKWDRYLEYQDLQNRLMQESMDRRNQYIADYFGNLYTPLKPPYLYEGFNFDLWSYKNGGKVNPKDKLNLEEAKLLQKDILEQVKRSEKKLERLEKLTQKIRSKKK